jgi:hypothetical protein
VTTKRRASLTGSWSGAFRYPGDAFPETVFNAQIEESGGAFVGSTREPNTADPWLKARVLCADIEGVRSGLSITFTKFYDEDAALDFAIRYEGEADEALMRIDGIWINPEWSGPFFMVRDDEAQANEATERAEIAGDMKE